MSDAVQQHRGFTIVELLVVMAVIGVLVALFLPAVQDTRQSARRAECLNNLRQIGLALQNYESAHSVLPFASNISFPPHTRFTQNKHMWVEFLLPYLDQQPLYQKIDFSQPNDGGPNRALFESQFFPILACPANPFARSFATDDGNRFAAWGTADYPGDGPIMGLGYPLSVGSALPDVLPPDCIAYGMGSFCVSDVPLEDGSAPWLHSEKLTKFPGFFSRGVTASRMRDATDGTSNTFMAGERNPEHCGYGGAFSWNLPVFFTGQMINSPTKHADPRWHPPNCGASSHHPGGAMFLFADGSVRLLSEFIDFRTYCYLGDKADGQGANVGEN